MIYSFLLSLVAGFPLLLLIGCCFPALRTSSYRLLPFAPLPALLAVLFSDPGIEVQVPWFFMGGSMGSVVGERFARAAAHCTENRVPLVSFSASGGARMQEALFSLLQMAKTSAALAVLGEAKIPFISVLTDPIFRNPNGHTSTIRIFSLHA